MKNIILFILKLAVCIPFISSSVCAQNKAVKSYPLSDLIELHDITYKKVKNQALKLDIYRSKFQKDNTPVVVYIHGGGWATGDKSDIKKDYRKELLSAMVNNGYAVISIEYRLTNIKDTHFPDPIIDCKDAVRWIRKNAKSYQLDAQHIGVWGTSAGSQLAMLLAYSSDFNFTGDPTLKGYSAKVKYVLNNYGPTDLTALFKPNTNDFLLWFLKIFSNEKYNKRQSRLAAFTGLNVDTQKAEIEKICKLYSPVTYINKQTVPTLSFHGLEDQTVPVTQAKILESRFKQQGASNELIVYSKEGHGLKTLNPAQIRDLVKKSMNFIARF